MMLVSSFGYLNKNVSVANNELNISNGKVKKSVSKENLVSNINLEGEQHVKSTAFNNLSTKHLDVIA